MKKKRAPHIAIAPCSFALPTVVDNTVWMQLTPSGHFAPNDGREMDVPSWYIDAAAATKVIERFQSKKTPPVVDYEHQTLNKEKNGQPAPAAGFMQDMEWREGQGLFAKVAATRNAAQFIADDEYKYTSPVFMYDPQSGAVLDVLMAAITNYPAIDGMQAISLRAAATAVFSTHDPDEETNDMNPLLKAVLALLGMPDTTTEEQAIAALESHKGQQAELRKLLDIKDAPAADADKSIAAACASLKSKAAAAADPAKHVPVAVVDQLKGEVAALSARLQERDEQDVNALIDEALKDGRLLKPMEAWARDLGKKNREALIEYLKAAKPMAALTSSQTKGHQPPDEKTGLTAEEMAVCSSMGISHEQFKAAKGA